MEYSFYFESIMRDLNKPKILKFCTKDGTEFTLSEEWLAAGRRRSICTTVQRLIFLKENNYDRQYQVRIEVTSSGDFTFGKIVKSKITNPLRTSFVIPLSEFKHSMCPDPCKIFIFPTTVHEGVEKDMLIYKVTLTLLYSKSLSSDTETIPKRDKVLIFSDQICSLLKFGLCSDIVITDGTTKIRAHRNILSARSIYFQRMFQHNWQENQTGIVHFHNTDIWAIYEMLYYIYSGTIRPMEFSTMYDLFEIANMYLMYDLRKMLSEELKKRLAVGNAVGIFMLAHFTSDLDLKFHSAHFLVDNFHQIHQTEFWRCLQNESEFSEIAQEIRRELRLEIGRKIRREIDQLIPLIRFDIFDKNNFGEV